MAEEVGFEPTVDFHLRRFSRPVHSTTLPLLRQNPNSCTRLILKEAICNKTDFPSRIGSKLISWRHLTSKPSLPMRRIYLRDSKTTNSAKRLIQ